MSEKTDIKSMDLEELKTFFSDMGEKAFRAKQVYEWLHVRQVESFEEMTNLSKTLRKFCQYEKDDDKINLRRNGRRIQL